MLLFIAIFASGTVGKKQQMSEHIPVKFTIRHADPWSVKAMLEGGSIGSPEQSTLWQLLGGSNRSGGNMSNGGSPILGDGFLVVNPTDNSLWWYPKRSL